MGDHSAIEWTDATWNPVVGCSVVSPGCSHCYAMKLAARLARMGGTNGQKYAGLTRAGHGGPVWTGVVRLAPAALDQPLRWRRPRRIFVNSMSDLFHAALGWEAIDAVFAAMLRAPWHTYQILTKRPERMRSYMRDPATPIRLGQAVGNWPPKRVWLGTSVEDQARASLRLPDLLETPALVRFLSCEPLLGPVDLTPWLETGALHWVIAGGESGPRACPMDPAWVRALREQCGAADIAFYFKQWGSWGPGADGRMIRVGRPAAGRMLDGRLWDEFPGIIEALS